MKTSELEFQNDTEVKRQAHQDNVTNQNKAEHAELLKIIHQLENKLATAAPGRECHWARQVMIDLRRLEDNFREHIESSGDCDGLFQELAFAMPNWIPRMERLQQRQEGLVRRLDSLISQIDNYGPNDIPDFGEIRRSIADAIEEVRTVHALENDLIFECFQTDLGVGD